MNKYQFKALIKIRELLSSPDKWTQGAPARTSDGGIISSCDKKAYCWCLYGAILKVSYETTKVNKKLIRNQLVTMIYRKIGNIGEWNDSHERKHSDVIKLLDSFIEIDEED